MLQTVTKEISVIFCMSLLYAGFMFMVWLQPPTYMGIYDTIIMYLPYLVISCVGLTAITRRNYTSRLKIYARLQAFNGILSVYTYFFIIGCVYSFVEDHFWNKNGYFMFMLVIWNFANAVFVILSTINTKALMQEKKELDEVMDDISDVLQEDQKIDDEEENIESPVVVTIDKTQVPPEWDSLYPKIAHNV